VATRWAQQLLEGEPVLVIGASGPP
jgi:hypothetical protein